MAWGKSEEQKAEEQAARNARETEQREAEEAAEFAASPLGLAIAAHTNGDAFFQVQIEVSSLTGTASFFGSSENDVHHSGKSTDTLGQIEKVGWRLEHVGYVFIETGSTSTNRVMSTGQGVVTRGNVTGIYLFRRTSG
ncbi:hypothetical protein [Paeniglutamicibacter cryotolerans]|uniref:Uncharacterized protein n=1 Tax=Paeniglutamicibacter cryotolerans TaxID=670079 RepID=A0A839QI15_9MICC|nr:hypothetical protein [Paeniglutamicibacter cryotolerans]MBB2994155.1 hypothetical protein [Paeniglutamicibacter cryotolerans]